MHCSHSHYYKMEDFLKMSCNKYKRIQQHQLLSNIACRRTPDNADVTLVCGEMKLHCHMLVLASSSPYFEAMFQSGFEEAKTKKVVFDINNVDPDTLNCVIDFLYLGEVPLDNFRTEEQIKKVFAASHMMQLENLTEYCVNALANGVSQGNCYDLWNIAVSYDSTILKGRVLDYIYNNFTQMTVMEEFLSLSFDQVKDLIIFLKTRLPFLDEMLAKLLKWLMYDVVERKKFAVSLLDCIDTKQISRTCVTALLTDKSIMKSSEEIANAMNKLAVGVFVFTPEVVKRRTETIKIRYKLENLAQLKGCERSPPKCINGLQWRLEVECNKASGGQKGRKKGHRSLSVFIGCAADNTQHSCTSWTANAEVHVKLLSQKTAVMPFLRSFTHMFSPMEPNWGWDYFFSWINALDPKFGFIKDDAIILEASINTEVPLLIP